MDLYPFHVCVYFCTFCWRPWWEVEPVMGRPLTLESSITQLYKRFLYLTVFRLLLLWKRNSPRSKLAWDMLLLCLQCFLFVVLFPFISGLPLLLSVFSLSQQFHFFAGTAPLCSQYFFSGLFLNPFSSLLFPFCFPVLKYGFFLATILIRTSRSSALVHLSCWLGVKRKKKRKRKKGLHF